MKHFIEQLHKLVSQLEQRTADIHLAGFHVLPARPELLDKIEKKLGCALEPAIRSFYSQCNGFSLCWEDRTSPYASRAIHSEPEWYFESGPGSFCIQPLEMSFSPQRQDEIMDGYDYFLDETFEVFGHQLSGRKFLRSLVPIEDYFEQESTFLVTAVQNDQGKFCLALSEEQGAELQLHETLDFEGYLQQRLATFGLSPGIVFNQYTPAITTLDDALAVVRA